MSWLLIIKNVLGTIKFTRKKHEQHRNLYNPILCAKARAVRLLGFIIRNTKFIKNSDTVKVLYKISFRLQGLNTESYIKRMYWRDWKSPILRAAISILQVFYFLSKWGNLWGIFDRIGIKQFLMSERSQIAVKILFDVVRGRLHCKTILAEIWFRVPPVDTQTEQIFAPCSARTDVLHNP